MRAALTLGVCLAGIFGRGRGASRAARSCDAGRGSGGCGGYHAGGPRNWSPTRPRRLVIKRRVGAYYKDGNRGPDYLLIRVIPTRLEVVSPNRGLENDADTWLPVIVSLR